MDLNDTVLTTAKHSTAPRRVAWGGARWPAGSSRIIRAYLHGTYRDGKVPEEESRDQGGESLYRPCSCCWIFDVEVGTTPSVSVCEVVPIEMFFIPKY